MSAQPLKINLLGRDHHAVIPPDFATREEVMIAYHEASSRGGVHLVRVLAATLGLCTRLGRESGADYQKHRFDVLAYGRDVYTYLRGQGADVAQIVAAANPLVSAVAEAQFPRQSEVDEAAGNSAGDAGNPTASP